MNQLRRRVEDGSLMCRIAARMTLVWDWFDKRQIDAQIVAIFTLAVTYRLTDWAVAFATTSPRSGAEVAMVIAAVAGPWTILQGAVVKFYFDTRQTTYVSPPAS